MKRIIFWSIVLLMIFLFVNIIKAQSPAKAQYFSRPDFSERNYYEYSYPYSIEVLNVTNKTGMGITSFEIAPTGTNDWGANRISWLEYNDNRDVRYPINNDVCLYDIKFDREDGKEFILERMNLCRNTSIILINPKPTYLGYH